MNSKSAVRSRLGLLIFLAVMVLLTILADYLLGFVGDVDRIRSEARMFRSEAAVMKTRTLNIVPSIEHAYSPSEIGRTGVPAEAPRIFRSDGDGTIFTGYSPSSASTTILFLGGSTTESNEVDESERFVAVVGEILRGAGLDVGTINGGVRGHTSQDSINALLNRQKFREVDFVVLLHNINDRLLLALRNNYGAALGAAAPTTSDAVAESAIGFIKTLWDYVSYRSNALFLLRRIGSNFDAWTGEEPPRAGDGAELAVTEDSINFGSDLAATGIPKFKTNLRLFASIGRALGKRVVFMTQPLGVKSNSQELYNDAIRDVAREDRVHLIDLDRQLPKDREWAFLSDNIHLNNAGSVALGQIIARDLAPLLGKNLVSTLLNTGLVHVDELLGQCQELSGSQSQVGAKRLVGSLGRYPSFSPDGRWLLFQSWENGRNRIRVYDVKKRETFNLTPTTNSVNERHPAFVTVGEREFEIVFGAGFSEGSPGLERLKVRHWPSLKTRDLVPDRTLGGAIPSVGIGKVFFPGFKRDRPESVPDLYAYDIGLGKLSRLTNTIFEEWRPAVANDGTLYFIANARGDFDIYRIPPGSNEPTVFNRSDADEWDPAVSPDGQWVAFASKRFGSWDIFIASTLNQNVVSRITDLASDEWDPAWHPSGQIIVFASKQGEESHIVGTCFTPPK